MLDFARDSEKYVSLNPRLKLLPALILQEAGKFQRSTKAYKASIKIFNKALELGELHSVYKYRGRSYMNIKLYDKALADFTKAIELFGESSSYYYLRSFLHSKMKNFSQARSDIEKARALDPKDENVIKHIKYLASVYARNAYELNKDGDSRAALTAYNNAIELAPIAADNYNRRARIYIDLNDLAAAEKDVKKAIDLDPNEFFFYQLLDWILSKQKDWDQIITYWDRYLKFYPKNAKAYVERGGAKYHKGDLNGAVKDAKIAADMGSRDGKEAYEKYRHLVR